MTAARAQHILNGEVGFEKWSAEEAAGLTEGLGLLLELVKSVSEERRLLLLEEIEEADYEVIADATSVPRQPMRLMEADEKRLALHTG